MMQVIVKIILHSFSVILSTTMLAAFKCPYSSQVKTPQLVLPILHTAEFFDCVTSSVHPIKSFYVLFLYINDLQLEAGKILVDSITTFYYTQLPNFTVSDSATNYQETITS